MIERVQEPPHDFTDQDSVRSGAVPSEPITVLGLDHVQVAAPPGSEDAARRFYGRVLGLAELSKPPALQARGGVWFACGVHQLHVGIADPFSPATKAHPALGVRPTDLDRLARRLLDAGRPVRWDGAIPGMRRFYTADPWGNRLEFVAVGAVEPRVP
jgi:catechol 2,3-dioxygenase-like lactoylglutathione lyase family enzyme